MIARYRSGIDAGRADAVAGNPAQEFRPLKNGQLTAFALGYRTAYAKRRQRLNTGPKPQVRQERTGKPRRRAASVVVRYETGEKYTITRVTDCLHHDEHVLVVRTAKGTHYIPLHNKDVVSHYR